MTDRIGELRVRIRTDLAGEAERIRLEGERFAQAVLARSAALLEQRAPGRLIFLRTLPVRWRLLADGLGSDLEQRRFAAALADGIETALRDATDRSAIAAFASEAEHYASLLAARAHGTVSWFHASLVAAGEPLHALAEPSRRELATSVLVELAHAGELVAALSASPLSAIERLAASLELATPSVAPRPWPGARARDTPSALSASVARAMTMLRGSEVLSPAAQRLAIRAASFAASGETRDSAEVRALEAELVQRLASVPESATARAATASADAAPEGESTSVELEAPESALDSSLEPGTEVATRYGGLFYLLSSALELDLGEILWRACLSEGELLAHCARVLIGDPDDRAPELFGGRPCSPHPPAVTPEQHEEVALASLRELVAALPRRGLAEIPEVTLALTPHTAGRLLVASANGAFALFAWPATTRTELGAGVRQFLRIWPAGSPILSTPGLDALDPSGRLRAQRGASAASLLPPAPSAAAAALYAQVTGVLCQLFAARAGCDATAADELVARHLAFPALLVTRSKQLEVRAKASHIDLALRRAALDRDPGWVPWLNRHVRFVFQGGDAL